MHTVFILSRKFLPVTNGLAYFLRRNDDKAIVRHQDDVVVVEDVVGLVLGGRTADEVAAVDPDDHRPALANNLG
jgi:hypothetical protein